MSPIPPPRIVATHDGEFHTDDLTAVAFTHLAYGPDVEVWRTRDPRRLAAAQWRVDVGGAANASTGDFDHHFVGSPVRPDETPYAACGLVLAAVGPLLRLTPAQLGWLDELLIAPLDVLDTGARPRTPLPPYIEPLALALTAHNPTWETVRTWRQMSNPTEGAAQERTDRDARFAQAEQWWRDALRRVLTTLRETATRDQAAAEIARWADWVTQELRPLVEQHERAAQRAHALVRASWEKAREGVVCLMDAPDLPWRDTLATLPSEGADGQLLRFVLSPGDWGTVLVTGIPANPDEPRGALRTPLPEAWAGLRDQALAAVTGAPDAIFCHPGRWIAGFGHVESARGLAQRIAAAAVPAARPSAPSPVPS